jgi:hypothetical protein
MWAVWNLERPIREVLQGVRLFWELVWNRPHVRGVWALRGVGVACMADGRVPLAGIGYALLLLPAG